MSNKKFVVCERGYDYNDEYNYFSGGSDPVVIFSTREEAEKEKLRLSEQYIKSNISDLYMNWEDNDIWGGDAAWDLIDDDKPNFTYEASDELDSFYRKNAEKLAPYLTLFIIKEIEEK